MLVGTRIIHAAGPSCLDGLKWYIEIICGLAAQHSSRSSLKSILQRGVLRCIGACAAHTSLVIPAFIVHRQTHQTYII